MRCDPCTRLINYICGNCKKTKPLIKKKEEEKIAAAAEAQFGQIEEFLKLQPARANKKLPQNLQ